jgi:ferritin-like metal-binding protein YciE
MADHNQLQEKLVEYVQDAHAMETNVAQMLRSMIASTQDAAVKRQLEHHLEETEEQTRRLSARLDALDAGGSIRKEVTAVMGAGAKGLLDQVRGDKPGKNARDAYVTESLEIAAYELLMRLAQRAGDARTAEACALNLAEEARMREFIEQNWDRFLDMTLIQEGITV